MAKSWSTPPTLAKTVPEAKVAKETRTVSHPTKIKYESTPGIRLPRTPKAARESTIVGALDFFPARELTPTKRNERIVPTIAARTVCQNEIPKPRKKAPYESASKETFAPHQGQKRVRAFPLLSLSLMTSIPLSSSFI